MKVTNKLRASEQIQEKDRYICISDAKRQMVDMLTELQMDIEECVDGAEGSPQFEQGVSNARVQVVEMIQQKINALKENKSNE